MRQDDRRSLESVCGPLIFRTTGVTARELRVCQADKALFRLRENDELRPSYCRPHLGAMDQTLVLS
jgi:hypothetical protein